jgi:hypothetical protein
METYRVSLILIEDFGETRSKQLIAAAVRDRRTIRNFLRGLAGAKSIAERDRAWEQTRQRIEARYELLGKDELHTYSQIRQEQQRLLDDPLPQRTDHAELVSPRL